MPSPGHVVIDPSEMIDLPEDIPIKSNQAQTTSVKDGRLDFGGKRAMLMDVAGGLYALKKTLRADIGFFEKDFMLRAGLEGAKEYLSTVSQTRLPRDPEEAIKKLLEMYSDRGYGEFTLKRLDLQRKLVEITSSNTVEAWAFQTNNDLQREPVCSYLSGVLTWICRLVLAEEPPIESDIRAVEIECVAQGGRACRFVVAPLDQLPSLVPEYDLPRESMSEHVLRLNEEILVKNLELQNLNLSLERQVRKRTEELRRSEENYRSLVNLSPDPIVICSPEGAIVSINEAGLKMLGLDSVDEAVSLKLQSILDGKDVAWSKLTWLLEKEGQANQLELDMHGRNGTKITGEVSARFADLPGGKLVEVIMRDVTEKKLMQAQVVEAKSESDFLNDLMSHDITNYMISAHHFAANLRKSNSLTDEQKRMLGVLLKDIEGAFELSTSVRDMSRIRTMDESEIVVSDLQRILTEAAEEARGMYSEKSVRINLGQLIEPHYVRGTSLLSRLFVNLFTNSIKHDPGQEVVIDVLIENTVEEGQPCWIVRVIDHGKGIPDEEKERVFERFHRLDTSVSGTGLGLYVARFIAKSCGGKLWAEDTVQGDHTKGTTMVVQLPKADKRQGAGSREAAPL